MEASLTIIPLRTVKYNDRHSILTAYSMERGPISLLVPAGAGKEASRVRALTTPLSIVECQVSGRFTRDIPVLKSPRAVSVMNNILSDPGRRMTAHFLAELLTVVLREGEADPGMFRFLTASIEALDRVEHPANFHIAFLYGLARVTGIAPAVDDFKPGKVFDMADGVFRTSHPYHSLYLSAADSQVLERLSRMTYANMHRYRFTRAERNQVLDKMLNYYTLHYTSMRNLQSLEVLRSLF